MWGKYHEIGRLGIRFVHRLNLSKIQPVGDIFYYWKEKVGKRKNWEERRRLLMGPGRIPIQEEIEKG
jgi:hypothetical protein